MNLRKRLQHLAEFSAQSRQLGKTESIVKAAISHGGVVLTKSVDHARQIERAYKGCVAKSIDTNLQGLSGPFFFDHYAVEDLLFRAAKKIEDLDRVIQLQRSANNFVDGSHSHKELLKEANKIYGDDQ